MAKAKARVAAVAAALAAGAALAQPSATLLAPAFGNTLASTYPDGRVSKLWLAPDGTFDGMNRKGQPNSGKWTVARDRLCLKQYKPFFYPFSYCTPLPSSVDAMSGWKAKAPTGEPITVRLVKGRA